jgi:hypothetical protein
MEIRPGTRLRSTVCTTEVIVVRTPDPGVVLECGGGAMVAAGEAAAAPGEPDPRFAGGTRLGKRYADETLGLEVLCTKAGEGSLAHRGVALQEKDPKQLPASD